MNMKKLCSVGLVAALFTLVPIVSSAQEFLPPPPTCTLGDSCVPAEAPDFSAELEASSATGVSANIIEILSSESNDLGGPVDWCTGYTTGTPIENIESATFPIGTTYILCAVNESSENAGEYIGQIFVKDSTPPTITPPTDQTFFSATFPATPTLTYATATDAVDTEVEITYEVSPTPAFASLGIYTITWIATDNTGNNAQATSLVTITDTEAPAEASIRLKLMSGTDVALDADVVLPDAEAPDMPITPTAGGDAVPVDPRSVLALLVAADAENDSFEITDLQYSTQYASFYLACIKFTPDPETAESAEPLCYYWQFTVTPAESANNLYAQVGMQNYIVDEDDAVYVFFRSDPLVQLELSDDEVEVGESFTVTAQTFNPVTGVFGPATDQTLGAVQFDELFFATEFDTETADEDGTVTLSLDTVGTYDVGVKETGYYPTLSISVIAAPAPNPGGGGSIPTPQFSVPQALAYLSAQQNTDGSFSDPAIAGWAAIAFAAQDPGTAKTKLTAYMLSSAPSLSSTADYERHAMALMALGINPYNGTSVDYITPIVQSFDGTQVGDANEFNDDIFAVFPLMRAGYTANDPIIQKAVAFILTKQVNGAWANSVDITAAAVQAISLTPSLPGVSTALASAKAYLHTQQQSNGSLGNSFSTTWAMQAVAAYGESLSGWTVNGKTPLDYLAAIQQTDGGVDATSVATRDRVWATASAVPAALGRTWDSLLMSFAKPTIGTANPTATTATPVIPVATSTATVATTTIIAIDPPVEQTLPQGEVLGVSTQFITEAAPVIAQNKRITQVTEVVAETEDETPTTTIETIIPDTSEPTETDSDGINPWVLLLAAFFALLVFGLVYQFWYARNR